MRCLHEAIDRLHVACLRRVMPRVFRHGVESPSLVEHLNAVQLRLPALTSARHYHVQAQTLVGELRAGFQIRWGPRPTLPVIVYHHGIAEMPYDKSFRGIFRDSLPGQAHLVAIRAPFHRTWLGLLPGLASMAHFLAMCAVAMRLGEAVRQALLAHGAQGSMLVGTSLGGFLALVHHCLFGSADCYVPLLAGPDLAYSMLSTHLRHFLAAPALAHAASITALLDWRAAFHASDTRRVVPLLARYDLHMPYAHYAACYAACGVPVVSMTRGHITGTLAFATLRTHVRTCIQTLPSPST
ncbi:MAG: hypothetical protein FJZ47_00240 [Candidatus Tectomicrobia bacterium]|uniref:Alpha/beta hydrolase n=1 Tax=Tectimicrobiota bacterium TaxID=2528274 RepID=A0A938B1V6_UNCTE|nr:hypothetical protein [Candidatus Tectomicrobia bacterium]